MSEEITSFIKMLTERDLAHSLHCTTAALRKMRRENRGPRWCRVGKLVRYSQKWVQEWLESNEGGVAFVPASVSTINAAGSQPAMEDKSNA